MKYTGIALMIIGVALMLYSGVSHFALAPNPDAVNPADNSTGPIFSPLFSFGIGAAAAVAGFCVIRFGGRGFSEQTPAKVQVRN